MDGTPRQDVWHYVAGRDGSVGEIDAAADNKSHWFLPAVPGVACAVIWKILQVIIDGRRKAAESEGKVEATEYKQEAENQARLLGVLYASVERKVTRLKKGIR
jgi:hypothetical protein